MKYCFLIFFILLVSCSQQKEASVSIVKIEKGRDANQIYYENVELLNDGEQPAYFVILIGKVYNKGSEIQFIEKGYGDIWPQESKTFKMSYDKIAFIPPDSIIYRITYSQSDINPVK